MDTDFAMRTIFDAARRANKILTISHRKPDQDAIGSAAAFSIWARSRSAEVANFCSDALSDSLFNIPEADRFSNNPALFEKNYDLIAVFDCGDLRFAGAADYLAKVDPRPVVVSFDHHLTNERYADLNAVDQKCSSTCEMLWRFFRINRIPVNRDMATCLMTGIFADTDGFTNPATSRRAFEAASSLLLLGADTRVPANSVYRNKSVTSLRLWGQALSRLKYHPELGVASTAVLASDAVGDIDANAVEGVANYLGNFLEAEVVIVLKETTDGKVKGSLRTVGERDVSAVAKRLGGGGHRKAAGFTVPGRIVEKECGWVIARDKC
jgi:phosphoesterase RecJ-like protein